EEVRAEFVIELQLDLARRVGEPMKTPDPGEMAKRPVAQFHHDLLGPPGAILGVEMLPHSAVIDVDPPARCFLARAGHLRRCASRKELRISVDALDEIEHPRRAVGHEDRFLHLGHCYNLICRVQDGAKAPLNGAGGETERMSIVENKKAYHDYFVEEKLE